MKDQVTALMEAVRLAGVEIAKLRRGTQGPEATLHAIEMILCDPQVVHAAQSLEPFQAADDAPLQPAEPTAKALQRN